MQENGMEDSDMNRHGKPNLGQTLMEAKSGLNKQHTSCPSANSMVVPPKVQGEATYSRPPVPIGMGYCQTTVESCGRIAVGRHQRTTQRHDF
ncbi:LOW QUALITY PROTEIN: hypothetical protein IFM46972_10093 [Aspergillus udagawae]|uniref:Uncharacterized protein n=1 Tax=Aspergillus udagawae TaxID=91492 RepID=A0A8H3XN51_9EURO|nr:LOW QUALITY PROTEIN: hypothetical protein IFM46972_10093 [Aspergillus udagawae]